MLWALYVFKFLTKKLSHYIYVCHIIHRMIYRPAWFCLRHKSLSNEAIIFDNSIALVLILHTYMLLGMVQIWVSPVILLIGVFNSVFHIGTAYYMLNKDHDPTQSVNKSETDDDYSDMPPLIPLSQYLAFSDYSFPDDRMPPLAVPDNTDDYSDMPALDPTERQVKANRALAQLRKFAEGVQNRNEQRRLAKRSEPTIPDPDIPEPIVAEPIIPDPSIPYPIDSITSDNRSSTSEGSTDTPKSSKKKNSKIWATMRQVLG